MTNQIFYEVVIQLEEGSFSKSVFYKNVVADDPMDAFGRTLVICKIPTEAVSQINTVSIIRKEIDIFNL